MVASQQRPFSAEPSTVGRGASQAKRRGGRHYIIHNSCHATLYGHVHRPLNLLVCASSSETELNPLGAGPTDQSTRTIDRTLQALVSGMGVCVQIRILNNYLEEGWEVSRSTRKSDEPLRVDNHLSHKVSTYIIIRRSKPPLSRMQKTTNSQTLTRCVWVFFLCNLFQLQSRSHS
jgi:hypothetical protein